MEHINKSEGEFLQAKALKKIQENKDKEHSALKREVLNLKNELLKMKSEIEKIYEILDNKNTD